MATVERIFLGTRAGYLGVSDAKRPAGMKLGYCERFVKQMGWGFQGWKQEDVVNKEKLSGAGSRTHNSTILVRRVTGGGAGCGAGPSCLTEICLGGARRSGTRPRRAQHAALLGDTVRPGSVLLDSGG